MKIRIYGIRNCDTMKKAFAWLDAHHVAYEFHDYKKDGVPRDRLDAWARRAGWEKLANMRGPTWRKIPESARANLTPPRALDLLALHSSAIRRPVVEAGARLLVGFDPEQYAATLH